MNKKIKVLIVDDHCMFRRGLKQLLSIEEDIHVISEANDGNEALLICRKVAPDVILLDISMPEFGGLEAIRLLKNEVPEAKIIMLSMYGKEIFVQEALKAGASGYLLKGDDSEDLPIAIRCVYNNGFHFSKKLHSSLVSSYIGEHHHAFTDELSKFDSLSEREKEYFHFMVKGHSPAEISRKLKISTKTCHKHQTNIHKKLDIETPVGLLRYAIKIGFVDLETL